ncbi:MULTISPECIES: F0F1 ATP synthase subunit gamma [Gordonia]|jgi:F-type H+-transporting ATPase subunit gamma|uniref:ATP synthase gamma chain n=1 Tax=Gordonia malaquae NBRC 108250 TaxID=1223542 RepID=M3VH33_GORML|nr:F0F1 ATP synthase subunit gamma [Gordonia malaquae]GAC81599.1 ATP synthase gamma chain [Gordonia malaquae NBRC 108250]SEC30891.1 F-type H+-transporting ATPase subunit gamma [Gordonia malaquae]
MATIRELRSRIRSIQSTKKITKAQELIATSRITKAQARVAAARPYSEEITRVVTTLASASSSLDSPLLTARETPKRAAVLVVTSDSGQCGGYNSNVLKETEELLSLLRSEGKTPVVYVMGRKGIGYYTFRDRPIAASWSGFSQQPAFADSAAAVHHLVDAFLAGSDESVALPQGGEIEGFDELHVVYTRFVSMLTQKPIVRRMAPIDIEFETEQLQMGDDMLVDNGNAHVSAEVEFEPEAKELLDALLPKYVASRIFAALLDAAASENAARRTAMKAATDNANELEKSLSRQANAARQAQITQEISEIVGGVEALAN